MDNLHQTSSTPPHLTPSCSRSWRSSLAHRMSTLSPPPSLTVDECHHRAELAASTPTWHSGERPPLPPCLTGSPLNVGPVGEDEVEVRPPMSCRWLRHQRRSSRGDRAPRFCRAGVMGRLGRFSLWARSVHQPLGQMRPNTIHQLILIFHFLLQLQKFI
jgi:hypothetical protein